MWQTLELPGPVSIQQVEGGYVGSDLSDGGAVGCTMMIYMELDAAAAYCPKLLSPTQTANLSVALGRLGQFYAENAVPATTTAVVEKAWRDHRAAFKADNDKRGEECSSIKGTVSEFADSLLGDQMDAFLDKALATPRLPVTNPCL